MAELKRGIEIERKYIIMKPEAELLEKMPDYDSSEITQIYLTSENGVTHRIRKRVYGGKAKYYETKKTRIDRMSVIEDEGEISAEDFSELKSLTDPRTKTIHKVRHSFTYKGRCFEIDVYPEWKKTAILEVELPDRECLVDFPDLIEVCREVTGEKGYSNAAMSMSFPKEII